ncbi:hypothetical protein HRR83_006183 [Exophiala dermatitidis]|uniref:Uncharacterized protein n=2 Tax=Exophiala dermatitidis TaxID=5970 RepID=H6BMA2_EXODN|nr:uncharacterized protein HMPREF1120_01184 [Exophiala dermatitidis NIH/UT8656]KAJ4512211.1 hypothetical protein HRR75_005111 [Exophiala dermatitidis]EHY52983.1 hypothetical protein HMPREF1120_01184 [Exophiala dermatitidis NIH/UT8656]KAJ4515114.1 hypothetical protein HRR74_005579 [Exophiala dermatitidis]KAJ4517607.1 hypothetical protein HRR73_004659 [Exophiala dermatitidis]KAJ4548634.1 hypothetical protein HRR76_001224 [Exophiala dermatitidis]
MSAPNAGRQSPEPEQQSGSQLGNQAGSGKIDESKSKDQGKDNQTQGLSSNPTPVLKEHSEATTSKKS